MSTKSTPACLVPRHYYLEPTLMEASGERSEAKQPWDETHLPKKNIRQHLGDFPSSSEVEVVRHFTRLSQLNFSLDEGMYPLGSCTMKYNPKINERVAALDGFAQCHPMQPDRLSQGSLELLFNLQSYLAKITGMDAVSLQPAAGAQGEFVGLKAIAAYHQQKGEKRHKVLIPDSAHGTNAASTALCGLTVVPLKSNRDGIITAEQVASVMDESVAALMITIPNTLGIFESEITKIAEVIHQRGGFIYCDGANLNALMCRVNFKRMGVDVMHMNLHKTMSTPHGGGGPGAGPVAAVDSLAPYLPSPYVVKEEQGFTLKDRGPLSIGRVKPFHGSFAVLVRAYAYILAHGGTGLRDVSGNAVLNANYLRKALEEDYEVAFKSPSLHEVVFSDRRHKASSVTTMDIAKRLLDFGFHPPTVYFPLIVKGALMIEPTETVTLRELDRFVAAMRKISQEVKEEPDTVKEAPHMLTLKRLDEAKAARQPVLTWNANWRRQ